jgi:uncharacterized protein YjeT (DUF2065 family)
MDIATVLLAGAGVWFLVEGAIYALAPGVIRKLAQSVIAMPPRDLVIGGAITAALGLLFITLAVRAA